MGPARRSYRMARATAVAGAAVLVAVVAFVAGRGSAGEVPATSEAAQLPSSEQSHTPEGAMAAYVRQQALLADPRLWVSDPVRRAQALRGVVASSALRRSIERSIDAAIGDGDPLGRILRSHRSVLARSAPLGYRILSYSPHRSVFEVWVFSLLGGDGIPLDLRLVRYRATEIWVAREWRLAGTRSLGEGNAVRFRGAPELSSQLADSLGRSRSFRHEP